MADHRVRLWTRLLILALAAAAWGAAAPAPAVEGPVEKKLYPRILKSSVWVVIPKGPPDAGKVEFHAGTGWVADVKRRLVVTNFHVVRGKEAVLAFFPAFADGKLVSARKLYLQQALRGGAIRGKVLAAEEQPDLALIQLEQMPPGAAALPLAGRSPAPGERVHSLGNPSASPELWRFAPWLVKSVALRQIRSGKDDFKFLLKTVVIETKPVEKLAESGGPGASGGPLVNDKGDLVGVAQGMVKQGDKQSAVFIDVSAVRPFLRSHGARVKVPPVPAKVVTQEKPNPPVKLVDDAEAKEKRAAAKLDLAKRLQEDGLARKARVRYQDIIDEFPDTRAAREARELLEKLAK